MRYLVVLSLLVLAACSPDAAKPVANPAASAQPDVAGASPSPTVLDVATGASCPASATPAVTEGPYFKAGSPNRTSLVEASVVGTRLTLTGHVFSANCTPVLGAVLDFWQADGNGQYDNAGYRLRGHQQTTADGSFHLDTVVPGLYPGRTEHIHVKVTAPGRSTLTTQLFFPNSTSNSRDSIFLPALLVKLSGPANALSASYDFRVA